mmetsp:Transcript_43400/g.122864  ORF Transcript_43400/g.122864 Transcript_43400/m.122864 type:complete len:86 (-) Transcript_43400:118-375(-)
MKRRMLQKRVRATFESTAASGSSATSNCGSRISALAKFTRACWPPDSVVPRSPTSSLKPFGKPLMSAAKAVANNAPTMRSSNDPC